METYEFSATIENGFIRIPDEYQQEEGSPIKVVIFKEKRASIRDTLLPPSIDTTGFQFNREEANER